MQETWVWSLDRKHPLEEEMVTHSSAWNEVTQSCPTPCDPCSSVHGIFQASVLEWVAISFSRGSSRPRDRTQVSCIGGRWIIWAILPWKIPWTGEPGRLKFLGLQRVWYTEHTDILCTGGPRLCISTAGGTGSIPGWGTKIPQTSRCSQKNKEPTI